mmetsp:Transcript_13594/g.27628  ORF Transcript_13594/g.27628 Transcript_13594/m.27628 type:complete len:86 (+) Transcript_13594:1137-1394(+)
MVATLKLAVETLYIGRKKMILDIRTHSSVTKGKLNSLFIRYTYVFSRPPTLHHHLHQDEAVQSEHALPSQASFPNSSSSLPTFQE